MGGCTVNGCKNRTPDRFRFYRFPLCEPARLKRWLVSIPAPKKVNRFGKAWALTKNSKICHVHFDRSRFRVITRPDGQAPKVRLAHNAVPTLFKDVAGSEEDAMTEEEIFASVHASLGIDLTKVVAVKTEVTGPEAEADHEAGLAICPGEAADKRSYSLDKQTKLPRLLVSDGWQRVLHDHFYNSTRDGPAQPEIKVEEHSLDEEEEENEQTESASSGGADGYMLFSQDEPQEDECPPGLVRKPNILCKRRPAKVLEKLVVVPLVKKPIAEPKTNSELPCSKSDDNNDRIQSIHELKTILCSRSGDFESSEPPPPIFEAAAAEPVITESPQLAGNTDTTSCENFGVLGSDEVLLADPKGDTSLASVQDKQSCLPSCHLEMKLIKHHRSQQARLAKAWQRKCKLATEEKSRMKRELTDAKYRNEQLKKQVDSYKTLLWKNFQTQEKILNNQKAAEQTKKTKPEQAKEKVKLVSKYQNRFSEQEVEKAERLLKVCGRRGYKELLAQKYHLPSLKTLVRHRSNKSKAGLEDSSAVVDENMEVENDAVESSKPPENDEH